VTWPDHMEFMTNMRRGTSDSFHQALSVTIQTADWTDCIVAHLAQIFGWPIQYLLHDIKVTLCTMEVTKNVQPENDRKLQTINGTGK